MQESERTTPEAGDEEKRKNDQDSKLTNCPHNNVEPENVGISSQEKLEPSTEVREIPSQGGFSIFNSIKLLWKGYDLYKDCIQRHKSTVFTIRFEEERIMICDHKAMDVFFHKDKVDKIRGFGRLVFNPVILSEYTPSMFCNGVEHEQKKSALIEFLTRCVWNIPLENVVDVVKSQFEKMPRIQDSNFDIENSIAKAVGNVITYVILGESIDDTELLEGWLGKSVEFVFGFKWSNAEEKRIADRVFEKFRSTPNVKKLSEITNATTDDNENILKNITWATLFNAYGGLKNIITSCLICFIRLSDSDKQSVRNDADIFFKSEKSYEETLPLLKTVNAFYFEVARMFPSAPIVFGRAKKDFTLQSTSGNFLIKQQSLLCGSFYVAHRDSNVFHDPESFQIDRDIENTQKHIFTFGGHYNTTSSIANHKCLGQDISANIMKLFIIFFAKCTVIPERELKITGTNIGRLIGSDAPLCVKTFVYNQQ